MHPLFSVVSLSQIDLSRIDEFVKESDYDHWHQTSGQAKYKLKRMNRCGKMAEIIAFRGLQPFCPELSEPDFRIHSSGEKSFGADLSAGPHAIHIKSQSLLRAEEDGCVSWVFEQRDRATRAIDPDAFVVAVQVDEVQRRGWIAAMFRQSDCLRYGLFKPLLNAELSCIKRAIYLDDLKSHGLHQTLPVLTGI